MESQILRFLKSGRLGASWALNITQTIIYVRFGSLLGSQNHPNHYIRKVWEVFEPSKSLKPLYTSGLGDFWVLKLTQTTIYVRFGSFLNSQNHPNHYIRKVWELFELSKSPKPLYTKGLGAFWALKITQTTIYTTFGSFLGYQNQRNHSIRKVWELFELSKSPKPVYT